MQSIYFETPPFLSLAKVFEPFNFIANNSQCSTEKDTYLLILEH